MSDALAAVLMANAQNQRRYDPADRSRAFAARLMQEGSSMAPVQSVPEGIARALQGGLGGFFAGQADRASEEKTRRTNEGLLDYANIPADKRAGLSGLDPSVTAALVSQLIGQNAAATRASTSAAGFGTDYGAPPVGAPPSGGGGISSAPLPAPNIAAAGQSPDAQKAVQFLTNDPDLQLQPHQAAGLVGNLYRESGLNPLAVNPRDGRDGSDSVGISQWNAGRAQALKQFAATNNLDPTSLNTQLGFTKSELLGSENPQLLALRGAGTVNDAARVGVNFFRPADTQGAIDKSSTYANAIYGAPTPQQMAANAGPTTQGGSPIDPTAQPPGFMQTNVPAQSVPGAVPQTTAPPQPQLAQGGDPQVAQVGGDSSTSGPPQVPFPKPTPEQVKRYQSAIADPNSGMTREKAGIELQKELTAQWNADRDIALKTWQDQQTSRRQREKSDTEFEQAGPLAALKQRIEQYETKIRPKTDAAAQSIASTHQVRQLLDHGAFTGTGAEAALAVGKVKQFLGMDPNDKTANTQVLQSQLANQVIAGMGGSLGAGVSNADVSFMQKAKAGEITWNEQSLRQLFDINEREARRVLSAHDKESARILKIPGMAKLSEQYSVSPVPSYEEWSKANPPAAQVPGSASAPKPAAAPSGGEPTATGPGGKKMILRNGAWVPL